VKQENYDKELEKEKEKLNRLVEKPWKVVSLSLRMKHLWHRTARLMN